MLAATHLPSLRIALAAALSAVVVLALAILGGAEQGLLGLRDTVQAAGDAAARLSGAADRDSEGAATAWRHSASDAVFFYGGYYCVRDGGTRSSRLVLSLREIEVVARGATRVVGPFTSASQAATGC